jgi:hypothetical protein
VTPGTSLLVLTDAQKVPISGRCACCRNCALTIPDGEEQYIEYGIEPPASHPELRRQFETLAKQRKDSEAARRASKINVCSPTVHHFLVFAFAI